MSDPKEIKNEEDNKIERKEEENENVKNENKENPKDEINNIKVVKIQIPQNKYENVIEKIGDKPIDIFIDKVNYYMKIYSFTYNYTNSLIYLFRMLNQPLNSKISYCYLFEIKPLLKYFKEIASVYSALTNEMKKLKNEKEIENDESLLIGNDSYNIAHKTNELFDNNFKTISSEIKKNILSNLNFSKIDTVNSKFESNNKKMEALINELDHKKQEYEKLYCKNYENQFNSFRTQIKSPDILTIIQDFDDYILIEQNLISASNQMFIDTNHFLNEYQVYYKNSKELLNEYIELLRGSMEIYHNQLSSIFNMNLYKTYGNIDTFKDGSTKLSIDEKLSVKILLEKNKAINTLQDFNLMLSQYRENFLRYPDFFNHENLNDENNFKIEKYFSVEEFWNFLASLIPKNLEINYGELIKYKKNCRRSKGMFQGFKNSYIIVTLQGHILIFDEDKEKNEDIIKNKLHTVYRKSKVKMKKKKSKKSNFMVVICEEVNNKKSIKKLVIDTLNNDNLNEVIKNIGGLVDEKDDDKSDDKEDEDEEEKEKGENKNNEEEKKVEDKKNGDE